MTSEPTTDTQDPAAPPAPRGTPAMRTAIFIGILALVVGIFFYLSSLEPPPNMSPSPQHQLTFNNANELIGLADFTLPTVDNEGEPLKSDKKGIAKAINITCQGCHGRPQIDLSQHACHQKSGRCIPVKHPPKSSCIKCHRMAPKADRKAAAEGGW